MDRFRILGPSRLEGTVRSSGAKNAALPALAAALLTDEPLILRRVPRVRDITTMRRLLRHVGVASEDLPSPPTPATGDLAIRLTASREGASHEAPYDLVKTMRAGVLVLGPLLARHGIARVSLPGGCAIGVRPIDQHLAGLEALGAEVRLEHGYVEARAPRLRGGDFRFAMPTVTGTENLLMAAALARGTTRLDNCAREPEVVDLAALLVTMGARIEGAGSPTITIEGVDRLNGADHPIIADRIEGGTYLVAAALTGGTVTLDDTGVDDLAPLVDRLAACGAEVTADARARWVRVAAPDRRLRACDIVTEPHPGFPTDLQAQMLTLLTQAEGVSTIRETVFENRFQHAAELVRMGADVRVDGRVARVHGPTPLSGAHVMATDLRASACLVLAGLVAAGETIVDRIYHLDRGYEAMEEKLRSLGANVERVDSSGSGPGSGSGPHLAPPSMQKHPEDRQ